MGQQIVSIIVPVYKVERYLRTCLDSILSQTYSYWELILVDDGSPDSCPHICDEYSTHDSRIIVLHKPNGGQSSARNLALDYPLKGTFITFLDSDDFWHPSYLEEMMRLQKICNADLVQCSYITGKDNLFPDIKINEKYVILNNHEVFLKEKANIILWGKVYRRSLFDDIRMPIGLYNEDDWTAWKLYYRSNTIVVSPAPLYYYTQNPSSTMAKLVKKPDLRYIDAYSERIAFFRLTKEEDLEHISRLQLLKSFMLIYGNRTLNQTERQMIIQSFNENWSILCHSPFIRSSYKTLFTLFRFMPIGISRLIRFLKSI